MPDASPAASSAALADDLRRIREARGVPLDALHDETKIPQALLEQFEATGLADHPMFNRVYLRSLVRAYAELIDVDTEEAVAALDAAMAGTYGHELVKNYLERPSDEPADEAAEEAAADEEEVVAETVVAEEVAADEEDVSEEAPAAEEDVEEEEVVDEEEVEEAPAAPPAAPKPPPQKEPVRAKPAATAPAAPAASGAWDAVSPSPGARRREPVDHSERRSYAQWIGVGVGVVLLIGAIWGVLALIGGDGDDQTTARRTPATQDTTQTDTTATTQPQRPQVSLGDTMNVVLVAADGPVQGIRVTRDDDLRRPYWIEEGNAKAFPTLQRIVIEQNLESVRLLLEGYEYPKSRRDDQGRVVITREGAQAFVDSLTGSPVQLSISPEVVPIGPIRSQ